MSGNDANAASNRETVLRLGVQMQDVFVGCATEALRSIVEGSELTGAPGQPVQSGFLKGSFQLVFDTPQSAVIGTNAAYAEAIEDATGKYGPLTLRSKVGGFHSIKATVANFDRILNAVKQRVAGGEHA